MRTGLLAVLAVLALLIVLPEQSPRAQQGAINLNNRGTLTLRVASISSGGTAVSIMAANQARKYLFCQNASALAGEFASGGTLESVWLSFFGNATVNQALELAPGQSLVMEENFISTQALTFNATTTGHQIYCVEGG